MEKPVVPSENIPRVEVPAFCTCNLASVGVKVPMPTFWENNNRGPADSILAISNCFAWFIRLYLMKDYEYPGINIQHRICKKEAML
jgi:hypothetical protein